MIHLGPGSAVPGWIDALDEAVFGEPWGTLDESEHLWALPGAGFARWRVIEAVGEAELLRLAVDASRRRGGLGRDLLRHSQAELARMGVVALHLEVRVSNAPARALYEAEGWVAQGRRKGYYRDGEDAALYGRELARP